MDSAERVAARSAQPLVTLAGGFLLSGAGTLSAPTLLVALLVGS